MNSINKKLFLLMLLDYNKQRGLKHNLFIQKHAYHCQNGILLNIVFLHNYNGTNKMYTLTIE